jgi:hypothetical protein
MPGASPPEVKTAILLMSFVIIIRENTEGDI